MRLTDRMRRQRPARPHRRPGCLADPAGPQLPPPRAGPGIAQHAHPVAVPVRGAAFVAAEGRIGAMPCPRLRAIDP